MPSTLRKQVDKLRKMGTRQQLLHAAGRVFIRNGYHKTLISDIVAEAGVGQGSFYRNFADKRVIFEKLLDTFVDDLYQEFTEIKLRPSRNFEEYRTSSMEAIRRMAHKIFEKRELFAMFLREIPSIDKKFANKLENIFDQFRQVAEHHMRHAIEQGFARPCRTDVISHSMIGIALRLFAQWKIGHFKDIGLDHLIEEACDFAFYGIATKKGR